jgi:adenosine deaminase
MDKFTDRFIRRIPKTDLHVHLDGSLRLGTLIDIAKEKKIGLPSYDEEGLNSLVFKKQYASLDEYLKGFSYTCAVMQDPESLERISYELAIDSFDEGVRYLEVRFAPQLHMSESVSFEKVMESVDRGLKKAGKQINGNMPDGEPPFEYGIIVCAMRFCNENFSPFYRTFFGVHKYSSLIDNIKLASLELAKASIRLRDTSDIQLVGFDIAGSEYGYPAVNHRDSYDYVHSHFLMKTVHAGEAYGPESIFQAITKLHGDRIGHGLFLFDESKVYSEDITDKKKYIEELANYIAEKRITIEVCLTSNLQTVPEFKDIKDHPLKKMLDNKLSVSFCTDNRLVSHTTITNEIELALENFEINSGLLKNIIIYGFKRSFFYQPYHKKREYVRKIIDFYERVEAEENAGDNNR